MEKKITDFFWNAMVHDMQCIAYAYRPINTEHGERIPFLNPEDDSDVDPGCAFVVLPHKPPSSDSSSSSSAASVSSQSSLDTVDGEQSKLRQRKHASQNGSQVSHSSSSSDGDSSDSSSDYSFEEDQPIGEQEEAEFYKEVVKGQIFLGMTAMCHQPKQVRPLLTQAM